MIIVKAVQQRILLDREGEMENFMVLAFEGGAELSVPVTAEDLTKILEATAGSTASLGPPPPTVEPPYVPLEKSEEARDLVEEEELVEEERVEWMHLPDSDLPASMKAAFGALNPPRSLTREAVMKLANLIVESFSAEDWQTTLGDNWQALLEAEAAPPSKPAPAPSQPVTAPVPQPPPPAPAPAPAVGQLQWADGAPIAPSGSRARSIPQDSMGYPVLNDGTVDPGEVLAGSDPDEDGVSQL